MIESTLSTLPCLALPRENLLPTETFFFFLLASGTIVFEGTAELIRPGQASLA